jgi:hypothetical protein
MAFGTLKADTLTHSTAGSLDTNYVVNGSAKALCLYDAPAQTVDNSFNQSSLTDSGTGNFTTNFTNSFSARGVVSGVTNRRSYFNLNDADAIATGTVNVTTDTSADSAVDKAETCIVTHGDLA